MFVFLMGWIEIRNFNILVKEASHKVYVELSWECRWIRIEYFYRFNVGINNFKDTDRFTADFNWLRLNAFFLHLISFERADPPIVTFKFSILGLGYGFLSNLGLYRFVSKPFFQSIDFIFRGYFWEVLTGSFCKLCTCVNLPFFG